MIDDESVNPAVDSLETKKKRTEVEPENEGRNKIVTVRPSVFLAGTGICQTLDDISDAVVERFEKGKTTDMDSFAGEIADYVVDFCRQKRIDVKKIENGFDFAIIGTSTSSSGIYVLNTTRHGEVVLDKKPLKLGPQSRKCFVLGSGTKTMNTYLTGQRETKLFTQKERAEFCKNCIQEAVNVDKKMTGGRYIHVIHLKRRERGSSSSRGTTNKKANMRYTYIRTIVGEKAIYDCKWENELKL